jgi:hypothetical protein
MPLTGLTSRVPIIRDLVWSKLTGNHSFRVFIYQDKRRNLCLSMLCIIIWVPDTASDSQREVVCDAAEQLQDRGKLLAKSVFVRDDSATVAKTLLNALASSSVSKGVFMPTAPLGFLLSRAHAAATQEHVTEVLATSSALQLRSRSGGQGTIKRRGSVS